MYTVIETYSNITGVDLKALMQSFIDFEGFDYSEIYTYFSGNSDDIPTNSFKNAYNIMQTAKDVLSILKNFNIQSLEAQDLFYDIENIVKRIQTTFKLNKYLRTDISFNGFVDSGTTVEYILGQAETLQDVARDVIGSDDEQNDWVDVAVRNNLLEIDYSVAGGTPLKFKRFDVFSQSQVTAVVGGANGSEALGRDIFKKITYQDEDLLALSPENTAYQAVDIYNRLTKRSVPQFDDLGIDRRLFSGISRSVFSLPILLRQLTEVYEQDDTILGFELSSANAQENGDSFFATLSVTFVTQQTKTFVIK